MGPDLHLSSLLDPRVLIVTGKGGVGKSSVAAALAVAAARTGRRTCLVEVEGRQSFSALFQTAPWTIAEHEFRPRLHGMSIDPEASLNEYLEMFYGTRRLSRLIVGSTAVEFATAAAPGLKDVLLIGKVREMESRRQADGRPVYDLIIVDAPPTGRIINFLRAPSATTELVGVGPIHHQAQLLVELLADPARTHLQLVTLLEELPVTETADAVAALRGLGVTVGPLLVNRVLPERFDERAAKALGELEPARLAGVLDGVGLIVDADQAARLRELGHAHLQRVDLQARMRAELRARVDLPQLELDAVDGKTFGEAEVGHLAQRMLDAVAA